MKIKTIILSTICSIALFASSELETQKENISLFLKSQNPNIKLISFQYHDELGGIYQVRTNIGEYNISKDFKFFFPGTNSVFVKNNKGFEPLYIKTDLKHMEAKKLFSIGNGDKNIYLFISPTCIHSNNITKNLLESRSLIEKYKINFFFFPNKKIDSRNRENVLMNFILNEDSSEDKIKRYLEIIKNASTNRNPFLRLEQSVRAEYEGKILDHLEEARKLGALGTPSAYENDGKLFPIKTIFN